MLARLDFTNHLFGYSAVDKNL